MNNETPMIVTLREFIDIFGGIEQISAIYVDSDDDQIRSQLQGTLRPLDLLHKHENIMVSDDYLVLINGDYALNKEKVFEAYGDYYVSMYFPIVPPEYANQANELAKGSDREYLGHIAQYSSGCEILIKKTLDYNMKIELAYKPKVNSSISGFAVFDYCEAPEEVYEFISDVPPFLKLLAVVETEEQVSEILCKRFTYNTIVYKIENGNVSEDFRLFYTDKDGEVRRCVESEDEIEDD